MRIAIGSKIFSIIACVYFYFSNLIVFSLMKTVSNGNWWCQTLKNQNYHFLVSAQNNHLLCMGSFSACMTLCLTYLYKAYFAYVELTTDLFICLVELKPVKQEVMLYYYSKRLLWRSAWMKSFKSLGKINSIRSWCYKTIFGGNLEILDFS